MKPRFQVYESADGWRWRLLAANNRVIASGEAHTRKRDAERAVQTVVAACRQTLTAEQIRTACRNAATGRGWGRQ